MFFIKSTFSERPKLLLNSRLRFIETRAQASSVAEDQNPLCKENYQSKNMFTDFPLVYIVTEEY